MTADDIIQILGLEKHPEGGWYTQTFEDEARSAGSSRALSTAIYYLLRHGEVSHWHKVDAIEIWHFYAGSPLELRLSSDGKRAQSHILGPNLDQNERPQLIVARDEWQSAKSLGAWTLVGCTVAPGFEFSGFELAPPTFNPSI